jgi:hypothetical protein
MTGDTRISLFKGGIKMRKMEGIYGIQCSDGHSGQHIANSVTESVSAREAEVSGYAACRQAAGLNSEVLITVTRL